MRSRSWVQFALIFVVTLCGQRAYAAPIAAPMPAPVTASQADCGDRSGGWWRSAYAVDYAATAVGAGLYFAAPSLLDHGAAGIGPIYNPAKPASLLSQPGVASVSKPYAEEGAGETVPTLWMGYGLVAGLGYVAVQEALFSPTAAGRWHRTHDAVVGYLEGLALTLGVMELLKVGVGRLRPDFLDRARRYHCGNGSGAGFDCDGVTPLPADKADWLMSDGRKSFPSGHSATAAYLATYLSLSVGGRWVWGEHATARSRVGGILAQVLLVSGAAFVASSRVTDGRHHLGDVLTGASIGAVFGSLAYARFFQLNGALRGGRQLRIGVSPTREGSMLTLSGRM